MSADSIADCVISQFERAHAWCLQDNVRELASHALIIGIEIGLLTIQFLRMSAVAFDELPSVSDVQILFLYGNDLVGLVWLLMIIAVTYASAEAMLRVLGNWEGETLAMKGIAAALITLNAAMCVFEFHLFHSAIHDLGAGGAAVPTWLLGFLMLAAHQFAALWIMHNVIGRLFFAPSAGENS